jgi:hypothetical protein
MNHITFNSSGDQWNQHKIVNVEFEIPFPDKAPQYQLNVLTFQGPRATYQPAALDSAAPDGYGLLLEVDPNIIHLDGGEMRYRRTYYSTVPPIIVERESFVYTYPGIAYLLGPDDIVVTRDPITENVTSRIEKVFQRVAGTGFAGGFLQAAGSIPDLGLQPLPKFEVTLQGFPIDYLQDAADGILATSPTASGYIATLSPPTELVAESSVKQWRGNILYRETRYVIAR